LPIKKNQNRARSL